MKILVTGAAGFIGFHTCLKLVSQGHEVYGIDNINDYYDPKLKFDRLNELGFSEAESKLFKNEVKSAKFNSLRFSRIDLVDSNSIDDLFKKPEILLSMYAFGFSIEYLTPACAAKLQTTSNCSCLNRLSILS